MADEIQVESAFRVRTVCSNCGAAYGNVPPDRVGRRAKCRNCGAVFEVRPVENPPEARIVTFQGPAATVFAPTKTSTNSSSPGIAFSEMDWQPGRLILDTYKVLGLLGMGGMGRVYRVRHLGWNLDLAVKTPTPETLEAAGGVEAFENEAETWVNLGLHPHVVSCYYVRRVGLVPCVFVEYVAGGSLHDRIGRPDRGPGPLYLGGPAEAMARILDVAVQFAWGLAYAHGLDLVHRDVKPANALVTPNGAVKVTDFGLAIARPRLVETAAADQGSGSVGTPQYFSPEQARGGPVGRRSDLWSWGLCLLEMLRGGRTWDSGTVAAEVLEEHLGAGPAYEWLPETPPDLAGLLRRCFRENPDERPPDLNSAADDLIRIYSGLTGREYPRRPPRTGRDDASGLNNRAVSFIDLGRRREAEEYWTRALAVQSNHPESTYNQGLALWRAGSLDDRSLLGRMAEVRRSYRDDTNSRYLTALIHRERDDGASAVRVLGRFFAQDPELESVRKLVSSVKERLPRSGRQIAEYAGHVGSVNAVRFGPGGRWAVSGGDDGEIRLWNLAKRTVLRRLTGHRGPVRGLALSGNGRVLASGGGDYLSRDFALRVWDMTKGELGAELGGHEKQINAVAIDADGRLALSAGEDQTVRIWDLAEKKQVWGFDTGAPVFSASFSSSGRYVLAGGADRIIRLWEVGTGRKAVEFKGHESRVTALDFLADDRWFVSGGSGGRLRYWDALEGREIRAMSGHEGEVLAVRGFGPETAVSAGADFTVRLWDLKSGRCLRTFEGHKSWVVGLDNLPDKPFVLSGGVDSTMRLWRVEPPPAIAAAPMALSRVSSSETVATARENYETFLGKAQASLAEGQAGPAARMARDARGQPGYDRAAEAVALWSKLYQHLPRSGFRGGWQRLAIGEIQMEAPIVALDRRAGRLVCGGRDGTVRLWRTEDAALLKTWTGHRDRVYVATFSPDGALAATAGRGGHIRLWRTRAGFEPLPILEHGAPVHALGFSPDGSHLFSGGEDRLVRVWRIGTGKPAGEIEGHRGTVNDLSVSLDGRLLLTGAGDYTGEGSGIFVREATTGRKLKELLGHERSVETVRFGPGGRTVVSGGADGLVKVWDVETGECRATLTGHDGPVKSVSLSLDGRIILSAGSDGTLKLWDRADGRELRTFGGHGGPVASAALAFHGGMAVSGGTDGLVRVWFLDWDLKDPPSEAWDRRAERLILIFAASRRPFHFDPEREPGGLEAFPYIADPDGETLEELVYWLGAAGLGWVDPRRAIEALAGPPGLEATVAPSRKVATTGPKKPSPGLFSRLKRKLIGS